MGLRLDGEGYQKVCAKNEARAEISHSIQLA